MNSKNTAILFFSRNLREEYLAKPFGISSERFSILYQLLLRKTRKTLSTIGLEVIESFSESQRGENFGKRITNAVTDVFSLGYASVIIVGNDLPGLESNHLLQAKTFLANGENVIAPDYHGGAYLIGVTKSSFDASYFETIEWQTSKVFEQLQNLLNAQALTDTQVDLNDIKDLQLILNDANSFSDSFKILLKSILNESRLSTSLYINLYQEYALSTVALRGPPLDLFN